MPCNPLSGFENGVGTIPKLPESDVPRSALRRARSSAQPMPADHGETVGGDDARVMAIAQGDHFYVFSCLVSRICAL
jgi:hypothetical protein